MKTGLILLAAGGSRRLGSPKQLVSWRGQSLLRRAATEAIASGLGPVAVVLGAAVETCEAELEGLDVTAVVNSRWPEGMGTSLAAGASALDPIALDSVAILLCDQPFIDAAALRRLHCHWKNSGAPIVASQPPEGGGPPAIFDIRFHAELVNLGGDQGARTIIKATTDAVFLEMREAAFDIDTPMQVAELRSRGVAHLG